MPIKKWNVKPAITVVFSKDYPPPVRDVIHALARFLPVPNITDIYAVLTNVKTVIPRHHGNRRE
jgi:hypothetical protein